MDGIRKIYEKIPSSIEIPAFLKDRRVEVILLPLDESNCKNEIKKESLESIIGAWQGDPLLRPEQGDLENREPLHRG